MTSLPKPPNVATIVLPGEEDPSKFLSSGRFSLRWRGRSITKFREIKIEHVVDDGLCLPTLYLHFLDKCFRTQDGDVASDLCAGNAMSEVLIKLPSEFLTSSFAQSCGELAAQAEIVIEALRSQGEVLVGDARGTSGSADPGTLFYSLKTARPKAGISLPKPAFGIPESAEQYLFVNNHASVVYFDDTVTEAFNELIAGLSEVDSPEAKKFRVFLKVFYEGGFGYNKKQMVSEAAYLPVNVGTAAMDVNPAFDGQAGIGTGYPYALTAPFLQFTDTVPISIKAIREMSDRHGRYALAFTRCVFVWEGASFAQDQTLEFCSILPHGGFYYVPEKMSDHARVGGLVYSFGESRSDGNSLSEG